MAPRLVLITGASSGIGEAAAKRFGRNGDHVLLIARDPARLDAVAAAIRSDGGQATTFSIDLSVPEAIEAIAARITTEIGTPDLLINNAGAGRWLPFSQTSPEEAHAMMAVPYLAAFDVTHAFLPAMTARGSGGVVFVTSPASYLAWPNAAAYIAARRAVAGLAETLQSELKGTGVFVTLIVLGAVETPYFEHNPSGKNVPEADPRIFRTLSPEEAAAVLFDAAEHKRRFVVKPGIYRALFLLNALFPRAVARQLRRASKKARSDS